MPRLTLTERFLCGLIGAFFGGFYGSLLALLAVVISGNPWNMAHVEATAIVFAALGFLIGPFIGDAIGGILHLIWGFLSSFWFTETLIGAGTPERPSGFLASLFWFGAGTALALYLALRIW